MPKRLILTLAVSLALVAGARAQTIGYADAVDILARDCGGDIARYCKDAMLADDGVGRCLASHRSSLSATCAASATQVAAAIEARREAQATAGKMCANDIRRLCPMTDQGRGHVLQCLLKASPSASKACNEAITNAGWR